MYVPVGYQLVENQFLNSILHVAALYCQSSATQSTATVNFLYHTQLAHVSLLESAIHAYVLFTSHHNTYPYNFSHDV